MMSEEDKMWAENVVRDWFRKKFIMKVVDISGVMITLEHRKENDLPDVPLSERGFGSRDGGGR